MRRILISVLTVVTLLVSSAWFVWFFAYRLDPQPTSTDRVQGLSSEISIGWFSDRGAEIKASSKGDAYAAIGYAHGIQNPWTALILRQTALGRLGEWFGSDALEIDIAARMLTLSSQAELAIETVDPESRNLLEAYASGMNAALTNTVSLRHQSLVLLRIDEIEPWEPWHSIAVERLTAWLATTIDVDPEITATNAPRDLVRLLQASAKMKDWLALEGFSNSVAWAIRRDEVTHLYYRLVYGSSVEPYLQEFLVKIGEDQPFAGVGIVGTPFILAGQSSTKTWAILPHQFASVSKVSATSATAARSRIAFADGSEQLIAFQRTQGGLYFPSDSGGVQISWPGLTNGTDSESWFRISSGLQPSFTLLDGTGIEVTRAGAWAVSGPGNAVQKINGGVFVGHSAWSRFPAERLANWIDGGFAINIPALKNDTYSIWAERLTPVLLAIAHDSTGYREYDEAIQYLRNWDFSFSTSSIAGAIFDTWATQYWMATGILPGIETPIDIDSSQAVPALRATVERLKSTFGPDQSTWRWERTQQNTRNWPFWSMINQRSAKMASTRFAPVQTTGNGHPSSLGWGATSSALRGRPPGKWEAWTTTDSWRWSYSSDTNLDQFSRFRRTDAPLNTTLTETMVVLSIPADSATTGIHKRATRWTTLKPAQF